jgi:hypothetical protein
MGLVSIARATASAAYESGQVEVPDVYVGDPAWTALDDDAFRASLLLDDSELDDSEPDDPIPSRTQAVVA